MNIKDYNIIDGYHSLGLFEKTYPEIAWLVHLDIRHSDLAKLKNDIDNSLEKNKSVAIVVWDEHIMFLDCPELTALLNSYCNKPVWFITQLDDESQYIYKSYHGMTCKLLELPWWWLNDALCYYNVCCPIIANNENSFYSYLCMARRIDQNKINLISALASHRVDQYGLITLSESVTEFENNKFVTLNPHLPYKNLQTPYQKMAAQINLNGTWISANVENFLHIEQTYNSIPLIIQSETTNGLFFSTEKSLWPLLLGKMMLIHGRPGVMKYAQKFYDFDISQYANIDFDDINEYDETSHQSRLNKLINDNIDLVKDSNLIYRKFKLDIEKARWTIGKNLLNFCNTQIKKIIQKDQI